MWLRTAQRFFGWNFGMTDSEGELLLECNASSLQAPAYLRGWTGCKAMVER